MCIEGIVHNLGGVVVSVLATGPRGCGLKPGWGDGFLKAIKICSKLSYGWEVKSHVSFYGMQNGLA
jgi:hypothetical protein